MYRTLATRSLWRSVAGAGAGAGARISGMAALRRPALAGRSPMAAAVRRSIETNASSGTAEGEQRVAMEEEEKREAASEAEAVTVSSVEGDGDGEAAAAAAAQDAPSELPVKRSLPPACTGCGAFTQTKHAQHPGYYDMNRKAVRRYLGLEEKPAKKAADIKNNHQVMAVINQIGEEKLKQLGIDPASLILEENPDVELQKSRDGITQPPLCDRCHVLIHHRVGQSIFHPSVHALSATLDETPWKYNHVFHVIDAADFPMSLIPRLHQLIGDIQLRTRNRRSTAMHFQSDRSVTMSFVITRSDLLAPKKEQVDALMPYLREVLRETLGRVGRMVRLGNLWCVSAKRSWWTTELREEIWKRGGASWLIGKINVGKSQLFETVYPKGRLPAPAAEPKTPEEEQGEEAAQAKLALVEETDPLNVGEWLPPARKEEMYPAMPTVSDLAGTTASPIRIPFGGGKGELIDLPGLARTTLTNNVMTKFRDQLIMKSRIVPEQQVIKAGQSLLIGGMFRLTPRSDDTVILAYNFTPMKPHVTSTSKAIEISEQRSDLLINNIAVPGVGSSVKLAESVALKYDVTRQRAGPLTRKTAVGLSVDRLPFRVLAVDILIESVGWIELVAQVRTRALYHGRPAADYEVAEPSSEAGSTDAAGRPRRTKYSPRFDGDSGSRGPWHRDFHEGFDETDPWESMQRTQQQQQKQQQQHAQTRENTRLWDAIEAGRDAPAASDAPGPEPEREPLPEPNWPVIDIFSPHGHYIGTRRPMNGWLLNKPLVTKEQKRARPRKSMKGAKKKAKMMLRMAKSTYFTG